MKKNICSALANVCVEELLDLFDLEATDREQLENVINDGVQDYKQSRHEYYLKHRDEILARVGAYKAARRAELQEKARQYYQAHRDEIAEKEKARRADPEVKKKCSEYARQYYQAHRDEILAKAHKKREERKQGELQ